MRFFPPCKSCNSWNVLLLLDLNYVSYNSIELADVIVRSPSLISEKRQRSWEDPRDWEKKQMSLLSSRRAKRRIQEPTGQPVSPQTLGKWCEWFPNTWRTTRCWGVARIDLQSGDYASLWWDHISDLVEERRAVGVIFVSFQNCLS